MIYTYSLKNLPPETLKRMFYLSTIPMAVESQNLTLTSLPFKLVNFSINTKEKTLDEISSDKFHDWIKNCKKIKVTDKLGNHLRMEYHFPDEIIIRLNNKI